MNVDDLLQLQQPLKEGGIRSANFFNGRLLTARGGAYLNLTLEPLGDIPSIQRRQARLKCLRCYAGS